MTTNTIQALPPRNPHCELQWPYDLSMPQIAAELTEAVYGAIAVARLLEADSNIADRRKCTDDPDREPLPFTANVVSGLQHALNACLHHIEGIAAQLAECDVRHSQRAGGAK